MTSLRVVRDSYRDHPAMDVAVSHAILASVARGDLGAVFRLHIPEPIVAFGGSDRSQFGYPLAVRAAEAHGFTAVERLSGGRAAVFHDDTLSFALALPSEDPIRGIVERFELIANAMAEAFSELGFDARIGGIPGEYCPGEWSVNLGGRVKVMGVGQRLIRGAAHVGGVVVVGGANRIRDVLIPVYRALQLDWDPRTVGALADLSPGLTPDRVAEAIVTAMDQGFRLVESELPTHVVDEARTLVQSHLPEVA